MKSELSFLLELILDEQVPQPVKARLVRRVQEVEKNYTAQPTQTVSRKITNNPVVAAQSPSMQRVMEQNPDLIPKAPIPENAATAAALQQRQAMINVALSGKEEKGRTAPRKF